MNGRALVRRTLFAGWVLAVASACATSGPRGAGPADGRGAVEDPQARAEARFGAEVQRIGAERAAGEPVDLQRVRSQMKAVTEILPSFAPAWYNLGWALEGLKEREGAVEAYRRALRERPDLEAAAVNLAAMLHAGDRTAEAVRVLEAAVQTDPAAADARVALASHRLSLSDVAGARSLCEEALAYVPTHEGAYCVLARAAVEAERWGRVQLLVAQGLKLNPDAACLQEALGDAHLAESRVAPAVQAFARAVELDANRVRAHLRLAEIGMRQKNFSLAARHYQALGDHPDLPLEDRAAAWVNLGVARKGQGDFEGARAAYEAALQRDEDAAEALFNLATLELRQFSDLERSESLLQRFLQVSDQRADEAYGMLKEIEARRRMLAASPSDLGEGSPEAEGDDSRASEPTAEPGASEGPAR